MSVLGDFLIAAGGAIGGGLVVLVGDKLIAHWVRPTVLPSFNRDKHSAVVITVDTQLIERGGEPTAAQPGTYFRLHVANEGMTTANGCEVTIEKLTRTQPLRYEYKNDPILLGWSFIGKKSTHIHPGTYRFCDILLVRDDYFAIAGEVPNYLEKELKNSFTGATFEMTLCISGENFATRRIGVTCGWDAGVKNIVAKEIPLGILPLESSMEGFAKTTTPTI
jgi:hypothetical protein